MFDFDGLEEAEVRVNKPIVVHEDAEEADGVAAGHSVDQLLWQGCADMAKTVAVLGPGVVALPLFGRVSGVDDKDCLAYRAHPMRAAQGGLMDRLDLQTKFGQLDPQKLVRELQETQGQFEERLTAMSDQELQGEVEAFQDWRSKVNGRMKTLEQRTAWAFLGIPVGSMGQDAIKRAFKRRALELHPDKGGDRERFQLLQEMRDLLIEPVPRGTDQTEDGDPEKENRDEQDGEKRTPGSDRKSGPVDEQGEDFDSDESDLDVEEEFRKMFPGKKRRGRRKVDEEDDGEPNLGKSGDFCREKFEAARLKLRRNVLDAWTRAGRLAAEIQDVPASAVGGQAALRELRKFVGRFNRSEVRRLKENDPQKAERILKRFLEQGSEIVCAAGIADPQATIACIAMQVSYPLMSTAPSADLKQRFAALMESIGELPDLHSKLELHGTALPAPSEAVQTPAAPLRVRLMVPDHAAAEVAPSKTQDGNGLPGFRDAELELPPDATVASLRAPAIAALGRCMGLEAGDPGKADAATSCRLRFFFAGRFLARGDTLLADLPGLRDGVAIHCLPSNTAAPPKQASTKGVEQAGPPQGLPGAHAQLRSSGPHARTSAAPSGVVAKVARETADVRRERMEAERRAKERIESAAAAADGMAPPPGDGGGADADRGAGGGGDAAEQGEAVHQTAEAAEEGEGDDDAWFDDFFSAPKKGPTPSSSGPASAKPSAPTPPAAVAGERGGARAPAAPSAQRTAGPHAAGAAPTRSPCQELAVAEEVRERSLRQVRTAWDERWQHTCAGERRADGSAVFCYPCNSWITLGEAYDHRSFELHCEKVGHYGWID